MKNCKRFLCSALILILLVSCTSCSFLGSTDSEKEVIEAAEKYVNSRVYKTIGLVPESFSSEIIYEDEYDRIVAVKYGFDSSADDGAYCVYVVDGGAPTAITSTDELPVGFDFEGRLDEIRAIFGL